MLFMASDKMRPVIVLLQYSRLWKLASKLKRITGFQLHILDTMASSSGVDSTETARLVFPLAFPWTAIRIEIEITPDRIAHGRRLLLACRGKFAGDHPCILLST